jgi:hypothetical protein
MDSKMMRRPKAHKSAKVMWLSAQYRIEYKRDRMGFYKDHPEVLKMSSFDQQYILT